MTFFAVIYAIRYEPGEGLDMGIKRIFDNWEEALKYRDKYNAYLQQLSEGKWDVCEVIIDCW